MLPRDFLTKPLAHRGLHDVTQGRPENSREAVQAAVEKGYGIEIDLQLTSDRQPLVFHDYDLSRLTRAYGRISDRTASDLSTIPLIGSKGGPPVLRDILDIVQGAVPILIELKDQDGALGDNVGALESAVAEELDAYDGPVALMSFNPHSVSALQTLAPGIPRGLTTEDFRVGGWDLAKDRLAELAEIPDFDRVGACFVSHNRQHLEMARVADIKASGANILCWTVTTPEQEAEARKVAENITFERYLPVFPS